MKTVGVARFALLLGGCAASAASHAWDPFVVRNFSVEGAQRISEGTVYNYLPINIGDMVDEQRARESIRALYQAGFFQDVELRRDGDTLVIAVLERPTILEFTFDGNKDIKDEDLTKSLTEIGLAQGKTFDQSILEEVTQSLTAEYYGRGKYGAKITPTVESLDDNRVRVSIQIEEGDRAKIRQVNIVGNTQFPDDEIIAGFELSTGNMLSFIRQNDRYSKEALEGDLEKLRSYYMDRGFADFRLDDVQVAISPDKRDIFVTISIEEGDRYTISDVKLAGEMVVPEDDLKALILAQPGQIFSQSLLASTRAVHELAVRTRRLRVRHDTRCAGAQQRDERGGHHVLRRSAESSLRAAHQLQRRRQHERRGVAARDAADGRRLSVERSRGALASAAAAVAVYRIRRARNDSGGRQRGPRRRRFHDRGRSAGSVRRQPGILRDLRRDARRQFHPLEFHGHRQPRRDGAARRRVSEGLRRQFHGPVSQHRRPRANDLPDVSGHHAVHVRDVRLLHDDAIGRHQLGV